MKKWMSLVALCLCLVSEPCIGKLLLFDLTEMIDASALIVLGEVIEITAAEKPRPGRTKMAIIALNKVIRGAYEKDTINLYFDPSQTESADFSVGERCVYFISRYKALVQQYAGSVPINDDKVEVLFIRGEPRFQSLSEFIQKIQETQVRKETGDANK